MKYEFNKIILSWLLQPRGNTRIFKYTETAILLHSGNTRAVTRGRLASLPEKRAPIHSMYVRLRNKSKPKNNFQLFFGLNFRDRRKFPIVR